MDSADGVQFFLYVLIGSNVLTPDALGAIIDVSMLLQDDVLC